MTDNDLGDVSVLGNERTSTPPSVARFTPGPWEVFHAERPGIDAATCEQSIVIYGEGDDEAGIGGDGPEESLANAYLIAAAPELFEACKAALGAFERNDAIDWSILSRALAKALGEQP